jgi:flagellar biosynthetic protein FliR
MQYLFELHTPFTDSLYRMGYPVHNFGQKGIGMSVSIPQAQLYFLVLTRILAMMIQVPVLGGQGVPQQIRLSLGLILSVVLIPWQQLPVDAKTIELAAYAVAVAKELFLGTLIGFACSATFGAIQIAGEALGLESGFGSGRIFNPSLGDSGSEFSQIFVMVSLMVFLIIDGHHLFIIAMQKTFEVIPANGPLPLGSMDTLIRIMAQMIVVGMRLALPLMAALIITDLALGLLSRIAPQMQIFFLGMPVKVAVSLIGLGLLFMVVMPALGDLFRGMSNQMLSLITVGK